MKAWEITSAGGIDALELNDRPTPEPGPGQVLVRVGASAINYRDLSTIRDPEARNLPYPTVPNSDCAGVVAAVGDGVAGVVDEVRTGLEMRGVEVAEVHVGDDQFAGDVGRVVFIRRTVADEDARGVCAVVLGPAGVRHGAARDVVRRVADGQAGG